MMRMTTMVLAVLAVLAVPAVLAVLAVLAVPAVLVVPAVLAVAVACKRGVDKSDQNISRIRPWDIKTRAVSTAF